LPTINLDTLKLKLVGKWLHNDCETEVNKRISSQKLLEQYYEPNGMYLQNEQSYFAFEKNNLFYRKRVDGCDKFRETYIKAKWELHRKNEEILLKLTFSDKKYWVYKLIYLDNENNLVTERQ